MSSAPKSRWAEDDEETQAHIEQRKREKEAKRRAKEERRRREEQEAQRKISGGTAAANGDGDRDRPVKRRKLSGDDTQGEGGGEVQKPSRLLRFSAPGWGPCRHVDNFERLNAIEEGSYGWVLRARETATGEIVAIKKLKMENAQDGFPITGLREIQTLFHARHPHVVGLREVVMGDKMDDVYLVMDFVEHDLKTLLDDMREPFLPSETKTLLLQVISAVDFLHSHWIMHRDLKTSNLLLNNRGEIKLADFGMARFHGDPPPKLTQLVVTLWYRAPELLLGAEKYGFEIDMWSVGCIFGELLTKEPLLRGKNEVGQLSEIFALTGPPTSKTWPSFRSLPNAKSLRLPPSSASTSGPAVPLLPRTKFPYLTTSGLSLLSHLLALDPTNRPSAKACLSHPYFSEDPKPKAKEMFPTFPSKAGLEKRRRRETPEAPRRGEEAPRLDFAEVFGGGVDAGGGEEGAGAGFQLRFG